MKRKDMPKHLTKIKLLSVFILPLLTSCQTVSHPTPISQIPILKAELSVLNLPAPANDMKQSLNNGDKRFIGICGYACYPPGLTDEELDWAKEYGFRIIEGTSDMIEGNEHAALIGKARVYAEQYNRALVQYLKQSQEIRGPTPRHLAAPDTCRTAESLTKNPRISFDSLTLQVIYLD